MPDEEDLVEIFNWSLPRVHAVTSDGTNVVLDDKGASFVEAYCQNYEPGAVSERRYPKPKYDCVFHFNGSDGNSYVTVLLVEFIPESTVFTNSAGGALILQMSVGITSLFQTAAECRAFLSGRHLKRHTPEQLAQDCNSTIRSGRHTSNGS